MGGWWGWGVGWTRRWAGVRGRRRDGIKGWDQGMGPLVDARAESLCERGAGFGERQRREVGGSLR